MVICHFFLRTIKGKTYVMVDSSASAASKPLYASPEVLFEAVGDAERWIPRAQQAILRVFPELAAGPTCRPDDRRKTKVQCFDIPFYERRESGLLKHLVK